MVCNFATGIIGPYFFRDNARRTTTVTENYLEMLQKFFLPELENNALVENCYFQQDGAPAHYARKVRDYLNHVFPDRWIGHRGPLEWAARSPDLVPCDFFLWGFLKSKVCSTPGMPRQPGCETAFVRLTTVGLLTKQR